MHKHKKKIILIKTAGWVGIIADAIWTLGLLVPKIFGLLTGNHDFNPDLETRLILGIGGSLMMGWTFLLFWAVKEPIERRSVFLLTAFPVVFGLFFVALIGYIKGNTFNIWILIKTSILFIFMVTSYIIAGNIANKKE